VANLVPALEGDIDPRHVLIVTDDVDPRTLSTTGHLNHAVRTAIDAGLDPLLAIQCATVNAAEYMGMRHDLGSIAPGRCADILFVGDLRELRPHLVLADGAPIPAALPDYEYPARARRSVRLPRLDAQALAVRAPGATARVRVIGVIPGEFATEHRILELPVRDGELPASPEDDVAKIASIERHGGSGSIGLGFVQGLGLRRGAVATTVAHDCHNLLLVGMSDADMLFAAERLRAIGGGMIAVAGGEVLAEVALPIAGLMSDRPVADVGRAVAALADAYRALGSALEQPFMAVSFLALAVVPELRITNRGLVDSSRFEAVGLIVDG
jgi:adenine deaminase